MTDMIQGKSPTLTVTLIVAGPPRSGKSSLLRAIHDRMAPDQRGDVLPIGSGQTLLDWLPVDLGEIGGCHMHLHLYTVPPLAGSDATRRLILSRADGILFVADSQAHRMEENAQALQGLWGELAEGNDHPRQLPMALFYSKQDLPGELIFTPAALDEYLNFNTTPRVAGDALRGIGVLEVLQAVLGPILRSHSAVDALAEA